MIPSDSGSCEDIIVANDPREEDLYVSVWSEDDFATSEPGWTDLLYRSGANPLFLSWAWMNTWWKIYQPKESELRIIAVRYENRLVGLAPLYIEKSRIAGILLLPVRRLQLIGKRMEGSSGLRAEYMDFLIDPEFQNPVLSVIVKTLTSWTDWTELSLQDMDSSSYNYTVIKECLLKVRCHQRVESSGVSYDVDCSLSFSDYLSSLGKSTRLKLYNRRKLLGQYGEISVIDLGKFNHSEVFDQLNDWHIERWGYEVFDSSARQFIAQVFDQGDCAFSEYSNVLAVNGRPVSIIINVLCKGCLYNIQLGYVVDFNPKIALGTLHIGYQIESAFLSADINTFDFLEGEGKNSNYKKSLGKDNRHIETTRWIRSLLPKLLYGVYDRYFRR